MTKRSFVPDSTNISMIEHDGTTSVLTITFQKGGVYEYDNVPFSVFRDIRSAGSVGSYFHKNIRDVFAFRKIS